MFLSQPQPQSLSQPHPEPRNVEPFPQQLKRRRRIMIDEQPLLPPKMLLPQPHPLLLQLPPQNKRIRIKKRQLLPPKTLPQSHPQFDTLHIFVPPNLVYNT